MPNAAFSGVDVSAVMLATARRAIEKGGHSAGIELIQADALEVQPGLFGGRRFGEVFFSYALSMIPDWENALSHAMEVVEEGGTLSIVDFGDQAGWPSPLRAMLRFWLRLFHVSPREDLSSRVVALAASRDFELREARSLYLGYSQLLILKRRAACSAVIGM
jgi:S-adenosylmethionine-diacylgycerolhomoserine-N-methlytransferase